MDSPEAAPLSPGYGEPQLLGELENQDISESSGLAASQRTEHLFWTHNDSGDPPRVFAFTGQGKHWAEVHVSGAKAIDWEDMAGFTMNGKEFLLLADCGDNPRRRDHYTLYLVREPTQEQISTRIHRTVHYRYEDGAQDCEAVGVDPTTGTVLLVTKYWTHSPVYQLELSNQATGQIATANRITDLFLPMVTGMDISSDGHKAVVLTYGHAYEYARKEGESWKVALAREPQRVTLPPRVQGEAIAYGPEGESLFLTSEKRPTPVWIIPGLSAP